MNESKQNRKYNRLNYNRYLCPRIIFDNQNTLLFLMNKNLPLLLAFLLLVSGHITPTIARQRSTVWNHPAVMQVLPYGDGYFKKAADITQVEFLKTETVIRLTFSERNDSGNPSILFSPETHLLVNGVKYPVMSAEGVELGVPRRTNSDNRLNVVLHFPALPAGVTRFDLISEDANSPFRFQDIMSQEKRKEIIFPSYWRNEETGNWDVAFLREGVVYDGKWWDYVTQPDFSGKIKNATFTIRNGNEERSITIGREKQGKRIIRMGNKQTNYSMITERYLPDYPIEDTRTDFVDTGYQEDSVTLSGWLKDMPDKMKSQRTFDITIHDIFSYDRNEFYAPIDSLGRFTITIPLANSSEMTCDWRRSFIRTMIEPGKKYFLLYDFKEGHRFFMGDDARLQNELLKYPLGWNYVNIDTGDDADCFLSTADSIIQAETAGLDQVRSEYPNLSSRFFLYQKGHTLWQQGREIGQARFYMPDHILTDRAHRYATDSLWKNLPRPLTLFREVPQFIIDFVQNEERISQKKFDAGLHLHQIAANDHELQLLREWVESQQQFINAIEAETDLQAKESMATEWNERHADLIKQVNAIFNGEKARNYFQLQNYRDIRQLLDSLGADKIIQDSYLGYHIYKHLDAERKPLSPEMLDSISRWFSYQPVIKRILQLNDKYLALQNKQFDRLVLKSNDAVAGISEAKSILKKILEPYKGKLVILDLWGTWCSPCKEALSKAPALYQRLSPYPVAYVYLACNSPRDAWESVIKDYDLTGENVAHYNLPLEQQEAVNRYLQVHSYPTYKLFDKEGNLLDIHIDSFNLESLEDIIRKLNEQ